MSGYGDGSLSMIQHMWQQGSLVDFARPSGASSDNPVPEEATLSALHLLKRPRAWHAYLRCLARLLPSLFLARPGGPNYALVVVPRTP